MKTRTVTILAATALYLLMSGSVMYGFDHNDYDNVVNTGSCEECDLSEARLSGLSAVSGHFILTNLKGADLSRSSLGNSDMTDANLSGADLSGADLSAACLAGANLAGANLTGANIDKTNFSGAKLDDAIWIDGEHCKAGSVETCNKETEEDKKGTQR